MANELEEKRGWHSLSGEEILEIQDTSPEGLSDDEAESRLEKYGPNTIKKGKETSVWKILISQIVSPLIYVLLAALAITLAIRRWEDSIVIGLVVIINTVVGFIQEYRAENAIQALISLSAPKARVKRNGNERQIESKDLVPGDIITLHAGDIIPADARLIDASRLQIDESLLTGESVAAQKSADLELDEDIPLADRDNMVFMGTAVTSGGGVAVVVATGHSSEMGSIAEEIATTNRARSPLKHRIDRFAKWITLLIGVIAAIAFVVGLLIGEPLTQMFLLAVSLAVSAIPAGLPVVVTVALAISVQQMARRNAILRRLPAVETLGSTTTIISDKTGTLTLNQMTVQEVWTVNKLFRMGDGEFLEKRKGQEQTVKVKEGTPLYETLLAGVLANEASLSGENSEIHSQGDPTEVALLISALNAGLARDELLKEYTLVDQIPFESRNRYAASIHEKDGKQLAYVKGAPERIVKMSNSVLTPDGRRKLNGKEIQQQADGMARRGLRVLAMAYAEDKKAVGSIQKNEPSGLTFLGLQGMMDPPREDAVRAVEKCHDAGIRVLMVTGDNPTTAQAIAMKVGIINQENAEVRTGADLQKLSDDDLKDIVQTVSVYARVNPSQKLRLVETLNDLGEIVAVTGDGVNDAPALKSAHIGAAMGKAGTDVAKEASEMVITDDNFATVYSAVEEGRTVFSNIRKATFFLISSGIGEVIAILTSLGLRLPLPLIPAQILWLNVVTNGVQDVALAFEPGEEEQYRRPPRDPKAGILSRLLIERSLIVGLFMAAGTLGMFLWERSLGVDLEYARATALTTLIMFQVFHVFNSRSVQRSILKKNLLSNKFLFFGTVIALAIHIGALYFGPTQELLTLEPLKLSTWYRLIPIAFSIILVVEIHKLFRHPSYAVQRKDPDN